LNYIIHKRVSIGVSFKGDDLESFIQILSIVKSPLDDSDFYIMDFILKNCIFKMPIGLQEHEIIIYKAKEFNSLRQYLPHKQFTSNQISIINQRIKEGGVFSYNNFSIEDNIQIIDTYLK
jgi:hypothetical protein